MITFLKKTAWVFSLLIAASGALLTIAQIVLLLFNQDTICFNDGCEIVETLTTVSPVIFNLFGFFYFLAVFWTTYQIKTEKKVWPILTSALLLAALAAEGVLVGFQHFVINVFCSYCLIILALIVALNLLQHYKHILYGIGIFAAIQIAFAGLQFNSPASDNGFNLDRGTATTMEGLDKEKQLYLFFSSSCAHCEEVIETLEAYPECNISFNPIDEITEVNIPVEYKINEYDVAVNRSFLAGFGINEIPVLMTATDGDFSIIRSKQDIKETIQELCYPEPISLEGSSSAASTLNQILPPQATDDENCLIDTDCEDEGIIPQ